MDYYIKEGLTEQRHWSELRGVRGLAPENSLPLSPLKDAGKRTAYGHKEDMVVTRQVINTDSAPRPGGVYSQGIQWDRLVYTAGQVAVDPATNQAVPGGVREQTRQVLRNIQGILRAAGTDLQHVLKTTCFLADIGDFAAFNEVYREFFPAYPPARSTVQVGLVPPWQVEIEVVAVRP